MSVREKLEEYMAQEGMGSLEGESGLSEMNCIAQALGYKADQFHRGSSLESFLRSNPGAFEALIEWISEQNVGEWEESLESFLEEKDDEEDDDDAE